MKSAFIGAILLTQVLSVQSSWAAEPFENEIHRQLGATEIQAYATGMNIQRKLEVGQKDFDARSEHSVSAAASTYVALTTKDPLSSVVSGISAIHNWNKALSAVDPVSLLNQDKLNTVAGESAANLAALFQMGIDEENTLKSEIKREVLAQAKKASGGAVKIDLLHILKNSKFRGKSVLNSSHMAVVDKMQEYQYEADSEAYAKLSAGEKEKMLRVKTEELDAGLKAYREFLENDQLKSSTQVIRANRKLFKKIDSARVLSGKKAGNTDEGHSTDRNVDPVY